MLKESEISKKGLQAFKECLRVIPSLRIDSIDSLPDKGMPDYQAIVKGNGFRQIIYIEVKALGTPKNIREAVNFLLVSLRNEPAAYAVLVAPYISPESASICKDVGIGYIDLSGNYHLAFQQVFINREQMVNRYPFKTGLSSLYSPKSERILRVLLTYPYRLWKAIDLAKEARVSLGMITHVGKKLEEEEWLKKTPKGICLTQPDQLLTDWTNNYTLNQNTLFNFYSLEPLQALEAKVAEICTGMNILYALTGFSACNRLAPMVRGQRAMIYLDQDIPFVADRARLKPVDSGANVTLLQPYDAGVLWNANPMGDLQIATPIQVYLDLKKYPGRGEEAADFLYKEVIKTTWQQQTTNTTTSL